MHHLKYVIFFQTILSSVLSRKIIILDNRLSFEKHLETALCKIKKFAQSLTQISSDHTVSSFYSIPSFFFFAFLFHLLLLLSLTLTGIIYCLNYTSLLLHLVTTHFLSPPFLSSIIFTITTLIIGIFDCLYYTSLLLHHIITHLVIDFLTTM